jgi:hypothetical protein
MAGRGRAEASPGALLDIGDRRSEAVGVVRARATGDHGGDGEDEEATREVHWGGGPVEVLKSALRAPTPQAVAAAMPTRFRRVSGAVLAPVTKGDDGGVEG